MIHSAVEDLRNTDQNEAMDYDKIERLANRVTFQTHPLNWIDSEKICQLYLEMLLNIVRLDPDMENTVERLVFIQWMQMQSQTEWSLKELYQDCMKMRTDCCQEFADMISDPYRDFFMIDALIIANLCGSVNREILEYLADMGAVLEISSDELRILSLLAKTVLRQDMKDMTREEMTEVLERAEQYDFYISKEITNAAIESMRELVVKVPNNDNISFTWTVKQKQLVEKGIVLCRYTVRTNKIESLFGTRGVKQITAPLSGTRDVKQITAPVSGTIFQFRDNNINYGVIGYEKDGRDAIKKWVKEGKKS